MIHVQCHVRLSDTVYSLNLCMARDHGPCNYCPLCNSYRVSIEVQISMFGVLGSMTKCALVQGVAWT